MSLMETLTLIGLIFTFVGLVGLMVQIAVAVFNITWKI